MALGTIADVVRLDRNNRCLVAQGLKRIRAGRMQPGIAALFAVAGRDPREAGAADFGFALGPRLNAAGRLADMTLGIECLLTDDAARAHELAAALDAINRERRKLEAGMREDAEALVDRALAAAGTVAPAFAVFDPGFHEGVVGIIASRLKDRLQRPTFVFALGQDGDLKGSGRSVEGVHLRDVLDLVSKRRPQLLKRFGGHSMAAGCTIALADLDAFRAALRDAAQDLGAAPTEQRIATDGPLAAPHWNAETVRLIERQVWGNAFDAPVFCDRVEIVSQRLAGEKHLKLAVRLHGTSFATRSGSGRSRPGRRRRAFAGLPAGAGPATTAPSGCRWVVVAAAADSDAADPSSLIHESVDPSQTASLSPPGSPHSRPWTCISPACRRPTPTASAPSTRSASRFPPACSACSGPTAPASRR